MFLKPRIRCHIGRHDLEQVGFIKTSVRIVRQIELRKGSTGRAGAKESNRDLCTVKSQPLCMEELTR